MHTTLHAPCPAAEDGTTDTADLRAIIAELASSDDAGAALEPCQSALIQVALAVASECPLCIVDAVAAARRTGLGRASIVEAGALAVKHHAGTTLLGLNPLLQALEPV